MKTRSLRELYQDHQEKYPTFKENYHLQRQLFDEYIKNQHYIFSASRLLQNYGEFAEFIGIMPLDLESLMAIKNSILKMSEEIAQGKYDDFHCKKSSGSGPFKRLGKIKENIEDFSNNISLMQLFIDAKNKNPELYQKIVQYVFIEHLQRPTFSNQPTSQSPVDVIEEKIAKFEENKIIYQQIITKLRDDCRQLSESLLARKIKRDETEQFRQAVYQGLAEDEKLQLSIAPHATQFGTAIKQQDSTFVPSPSPSQ